MRVAAVILMLSATAALAGYPDGVPGAEVGRLVRAALSAAGEKASVTDPIRPYPPCDAAPAVTGQGGAWGNVEITCAAPRWQRVLRTGLGPVPRITLTPDEPVEEPKALTLRRSLAKGAPVGADDLELAPIAGLSPDQVFTDPADVVGRHLRQSLGTGRAILARHLEPRWMVTPGAPLVLVAQAGGLSVSAPAEAREAGGEGDVVLVVNLSSGREVKAVVTGPNTVTAQTNMR
ncbi:MAG: flagella basal body P-ring formation protein FlgA [Rhodobacteraceae bacterium PARR1]|nr:MAG: flagella basal body P-ring formation protein FlgA [Rhodobacteraceae bacterium PARR1]